MVLSGSLLALLCFAFSVSANSYKLHEKVAVFVNTVGPFNNPAESYKYYSLPYCEPQQTHGHDENLGEVLAGDRRRSSYYDVRFRATVEWRELCHKTLNQEEIKKFVDAIREAYLFEMFVDDLSVKGFVGEIEQTTMKFDSHLHNETHVYLFTHLDFSLAYNGNEVIAVNLTTNPEARVELEYGKDLDVMFSYSVRWSETHVSFEDRLDFHQRANIGDQAVEVHWLSIINSFVLVVLLTAFLAIILMRVLKKDCARYVEMDEEDFDEGVEEVGWKMIHGDVFRYPSHVMLFSSAIGTGAQILVLVISILILSLLGTFYPGNRGAVYTAAVVIYSITAGVAGFVSTKLYISLGGEKWASNAVLTACLFAVPFFVTFLILNTVAVSYGSATALPFSTILVIFLLWALVTFPLTIIASMRARKTAGKLEAPCKTNHAKRQIPPVSWYRTAPIQLLIAGFLPFSAIYIELHYIFTSVWGHRVYTLFGILSLAFIMLIIVTAFITVALTYFQLAAEDWRWWWRSFLSGSSTGVFMYVYAVFYYVYRSEMTGSLQAAFFFGYMLMVSYAFSLMLGAVSYFCAQKFVKHIYLSIHID